MSRLISKNKKEIGLSPYALVFRGSKKMDKSRLRALDFDTNEVKDWEPKSIAEIEFLKSTKTISWLNLDGLHDIDLAQEIAATFDIPLNIMSDVLDTSARPKIQEFENGLYISIKRLHNGKKNISAENFSLIITKNILLTFQEQPNNDFDPIYERITKHNTKIRNSGTDYLAFALLDVIIDNYIYIIGILGDKIDELDNLTEDNQKELLRKINIYKREIVFLRKVIKPAYDLIFVLVKLESEYIHQKNRVNFRDLQSNISEAYELTESYRETMYDQLSIYHTMMSTRLNDIMRVLTIISVIFIPITFIVGVYGMNFDNMPELHWRYGYFMSLGLIVLVVLGMIYYFKKKGWF